MQHVPWIMITLRMALFIALKEWRPGPPTLPKWLR